MLAMFRRLSEFRGPVAVVAVLAFAQSIANLLLPRLMAEIVDEGIVRQDTAAILRSGGLMLLMTLAGAACAIAMSYLSARIAIGLGRRLRDDIFARVSGYSLHQFDGFSTASLITRTTNDTTQVQQMLIAILNMVISAPMMAIGGVLLAYSQDAALAGVLVAVIPVMTLVFAVIMRGAVPLFQVMQAKIDRLNQIVGEGLSGVRVIRAFDRDAYQHTRFDVANRDLTDTAMAVNRLVALLMPSMFGMLNLTSVAILWFGATRIDAGTMEVGAMIAALQYSMQILFAVFMVTALFVMFPRASASAARINEVLAMVPDMADSAATVNAAPAAPTGRGAVVEFADVSFQYPGAEEAALSGVSFTARPGEVVAVVGGTGSGKTTLVGLIPRFFDVNRGRVLIDGVDIRQMPLATLRARIGYVPQKAVLFTGTVAENIRYGRPDATDDEVHRAGRIAQADEFVSQLPDSYGAPIAQAGVNLSGGQKQRLAIARALVRQPDILVLDDSFSALDYHTDARLRAALRDVANRTTVFIVAQRVSTVIHADRIVVLDEGRVAGIGRHDELLTQSEVYREIVASQLSLDEVA